MMDTLYFPFEIHECIMYSEVFTRIKTVAKMQTLKKRDLETKPPTTMVREDSRKIMGPEGACDGTVSITHF